MLEGKPPLELDVLNRIPSYELCFAVIRLA